MAFFPYFSCNNNVAFCIRRSFSSAAASAAFGECFLTKEVIDSVCETFQNGNDVELKNQKDRVEVREMKVRNVSKQKTRQTGRLIAYSAELAKRRPASGGILMVSQYQAQ